MITSKDLMIGDWINTSLGISKVICLDDGLMFKGKDKNGLNVTFRDGGITLKPILLTPEILEKNGFMGVMAGNNIYYHSEEFKLTVAYRMNSEGWTIYANHFGFDKKELYVHELQHALRLCGIEHEIIL